MKGSARILAKHWKLTAISVFSLSIAMALGILSLSISNTFLLLPPSGTDPERLVMIYARAPGERIGQISYPDYEYFRQNNQVFTDIAAAPDSISVNGGVEGGQWIKVVSRPVSENYFAVLGVRPFLGRMFAPGDDKDKNIAVMTYACWKRLGSKPDIVGKQVTGFTIVGVTPENFTGSFYGFNGDLLTSLGRMDNDLRWLTQRDGRHLLLLARLKPGVSRRQAQTEMTALSSQLASAYPKDDKDRVAQVTRATLLPPDAIPTTEMIIGLLLGLVVLVLLIACANVANLLLAVAVGRRQEAAIKLALGAPRGRLIREFLKESALICAASAVVGYGIAAAVIARVGSVTIDLLAMGSYSIGLNLKLDTNVAAFTIGLMLIAILATGLAPAMYASAPHLAQILGGEIVVGGTRKNARRNALVIIQVAVCTLVLAGMGLCERSLYNLRHVDPGFSARNLVAMSIYPEDKSMTDARAKELQGNLRRAVSAIAGVESVTFVSALPVLLGFNETPVQFPDAGAKKLSVASSIVDENYFSTFGIRVLAGRVFNTGDREKGGNVVVINHKMAETLWPNQDPLNKTVTYGDPSHSALVVGVVEDGKYESLDEVTRPFFYFPMSQHYLQSVNVVARTTGDPQLWIQPMAQAASGAGLPSVFTPFTYARWQNLALLGERVTAGVVGALSGLGLLLAVIGLFGAISYSVSERKKELGIRVALGARSGQLLEMVLMQTLRIAGVGVAVGILLGVVATIALQSQFYAVHAVELTVLLPVTLLMLAVCAGVAYVSARPWIRINPMEAVRHA